MSADPHQWPTEAGARLTLELTAGHEPVSALAMVEQLEAAAELVEQNPGYTPTDRAAQGGAP